MLCFVPEISLLASDYAQPLAGATCFKACGLDGAMSLPPPANGYTCQQVKCRGGDLLANRQNCKACQSISLVRRIRATARF